MIRIGRYNQKCLREIETTTHKLSNSYRAALIVTALLHFFKKTLDKNKKI